MMLRSLLVLVFVFVSFSSPAGAIEINITSIDVDNEYFLIALNEIGTVDDRVYTIEIDSGLAAVNFSDGISGAIPPSGQSNVVATYRYGLGGTDGKIINIYPVTQDLLPTLIPFSDFITENNQEDVSFSLIGLASIKFEFSREGMLVVESQSRVVPIPTAIWLFGSGLLGLVGLGKRKKTDSP